MENNPELLIEGTPLHRWVLWDSGKTVAEYVKHIRCPRVWGGGIEMAVFSRMDSINVHVYNTTDKGGTYRRISCFDCPGVVETRCLLYTGRNHYDVLKNKPRAMPCIGDVVSVEGRMGVKTRATECEGYTGIIFDVSPVGYTILNHATRRKRYCVEPSRVSAGVSKAPPVKLKMERNSAL